MIWVVVKMLLALGMVLGILFFLLRVLKRTPWIRKDLPADFSIRVLTTKLIAPRRYISLVEIGGEVLALGVSEAQISVLTKIEHPERLAPFTRPTPDRGSETRPAWLNPRPWNKEGVIRSLKGLKNGK